MAKTKKPIQLTIAVQYDSREEKKSTYGETRLIASVKLKNET